MAIGFSSNSGGDDGKSKYPGKITGTVVKTCIAGAMGGLIFGYDLGISGGVTSMPPFLQKFFPSVYRKEALDTTVNQYCKFDSQILTLFTSSLYLAALLASPLASYFTKKFGRRASMMWGSLIFLMGAVLNGAAVHLSMLILGRILLGIGVGFANQSVPLYLSEMAPYNYRGTFNVCFQMMITIGILIANLLNYFFGATIHGDIAWRLSLGLATIPALVMLVSSFMLPDTPNSLVERGLTKEAKQVLRKVRAVDDVDAEFTDIVDACNASKQVENPWGNLLKNRKYRPQLCMSILIPFFQQFTGINVVMFYAPVLFVTLGFGSNASLMSSVITGCVNVLATGVSVAFTDKWGRRTLFLEGGIQMLVFQAAIAGLIGYKFGFSGNVTQLPTWFAIVVVCCICVYVAGFAWSWGPLGWLYPSEIFPLEIRSAAQSVTVSTNMLFTFIVAQVFLRMLCSFKYFLFVFFAFFVILMTIFVFFFVPETKNIPIEDMSSIIWTNHWYWKRFMPPTTVPQKSPLSPAIAQQV